MSIQRARNFLARVSQNHRLQNQLEGASWDSQAAVGIANTVGYRITPTDLQTAIDETWGVLTEEELLGVAGGGGNGRSGGGAVDVSTDTTTTDGTYSPPPG